MMITMSRHGEEREEEEKGDRREREGKRENDPYSSTAKKVSSDAIDSTMDSSNQGAKKRPVKHR